MSEELVELRNALRETLDALINETHGKTDTPWIAAVKWRAKKQLEKHADPEPLTQAQEAALDKILDLARDFRRKARDKTFADFSGRIWL